MGGIGLNEMNNAKILQLANLVASGLMALIGLLEILAGNGSILTLSHLHSLYLILFGIMTGAGDLNVPFILDWCGFLGDFVFRGTFNIYCSLNLFVAMWKFQDIMKFIAGLSAWLMLAIGVILILCGTVFKSSALAKDAEEFMETKKGSDPTEGDAAVAHQKSKGNTEKAKAGAKDEEVRY